MLQHTIYVSRGQIRLVKHQTNEWKKQRFEIYARNIYEWVEKDKTIHIKYLHRAIEAINYFRVETTARKSEIERENKGENVRKVKYL